MLTTSLKDAEQLRSGNLLSLPTAPTLDAWFKAWGSACTGVQCEGLKPFFLNSVLMVVPAVLISTLIGSLNGYVLSKWKFRGSETLFAFMLFGVFMPMQVVLLPMSQVLGWLGVASSIWGLMLVHVVVRRLYFQSIWEECQTFFGWEGFLDLEDFQEWVECLIWVVALLALLRNVLARVLQK
jgi:ABC-type glycerol-3-phosphate transport system permease component